MQRRVAVNIHCLHPSDATVPEELDNSSLLLKPRFVTDGITCSVRWAVGIWVVSCVEISSFVDTFVDDLGMALHLECIGRHARYVQQRMAKRRCSSISEWNFRRNVFKHFYIQTRDGEVKEMYSVDWSSYLRIGFWITAKEIKSFFVENFAVNDCGHERREAPSWVRERHCVWIEVDIEEMFEHVVVSSLECSMKWT